METTNYITEKTFNKWIEERNKTMLSFDLKAFRAFWDKWLKKGMYKVQLPKDDIIAMAALCKAILMWEGSPEDLKTRASLWLIANGFTTEVFK